MSDDNDAKLVARIANNSPIAFDTDFDDLVSDDSEEVIESTGQQGYTVQQVSEPEQKPLVDTTQPEEEEEAPSEQTEPDEIQQEAPQEEEQEGDLSDLSQAALVAMQLKEMRQNLNLPDSKDLEWEDLIDHIDNYIAETINAGSEYQLNQLGHANKYVQFLLNGGTPEALQDAVKYSDLTTVDVLESKEDVLENIIRTNLELKGLDKDDIDTVISTSKLQNKLKEKASAMQDELKQREDEVMERDQQMRAYQQQQVKQQRQQLVDNINGLISSDTILGYPMDDQMRTELSEMIFKPNYVVNQIVDGQKVTRKITGFEKMKAEFDQDLEKQLGFAIWLLKGGSFNSIVEAGEKRKAKSLMNELRRREQSTSKNMPRVTNKYIQ